MTLEEQIKVLCVRRGISVAELARKMGKSGQSLGQKIKRGTFTVEELKEMAAAVDCTYEGSFVLPDGDKVTY